MQGVCLRLHSNWVLHSLIKYPNKYNNILNTILKIKVTIYLRLNFNLDSKIKNDQPKITKDGKKDLLDGKKLKKRSNSP